MWKHTWNEQLCSCELQITKADYVYIVLIVVFVLLVGSILCNMKIFHCNRKLHSKIDENTTFGMSKNLLREYAKIKPKPTPVAGWDYVNTY